MAVIRALTMLLKADGSSVEKVTKSALKTLENFQKRAENAAGTGGFGRYLQTPHFVRPVNRTLIEQETRNEMAARVKSMRAQTVAASISAEAENRLFGGPRAIAAASVSGATLGVAVEVGFLGSLKAAFGRGSTVGVLTKTLMGGDAVMGLGIGAAKVNELSQAVEKLALASGEGGDAWRGAMADVLRAIPVVSPLGDAMARMWGLLSRETQAVAAINRMASWTDKVSDAIGAVIKLREESAASMAAADAGFAHESLARYYRHDETATARLQAMAARDAEYAEADQKLKAGMGGQSAEKMRTDLQAIGAEMRKTYPGAYKMPGWTPGNSEQWNQWMGLKGQAETLERTLGKLAILQAEYDHKRLLAAMDLAGAFAAIDEDASKRNEAAISERTDRQIAA